MNGINRYSQLKGLLLKHIKLCLEELDNVAILKKYIYSPEEEEIFKFLPNNKTLLPKDENYERNVNMLEYNIRRSIELLHTIYLRDIDINATNEMLGIPDNYEF